ncbi:aldo/keto reductase [Mucilaginibacter polytrichastri]|uniref:NADP-dependent oxidoreductase domain-containing protein n=1 Tax=Mucilaginibacter polytrichastri TaxID=1302689 RepID=A0A1Q5ZTQ4_9SPHI|nr:aldo/keto reductase [Mucilaginibacter polytrichastri]OKS85150.1 hypothetical protein RG47T_0594 [Mucilaginibacter polytrichastri]SFS43718.1 Aldo/keto reductase family protein [Mucilaginibacter polytrichastri]
MRTVELTKGIKSSALGFGCASILGAVDAATGQRGIECALDLGITHFDLARSYGYGDAEQFVGKLLKGKRQNVVIATKFGIVANWKSQLLKPVKPLVRMLKGNKKPVEPKEEVVNENPNNSQALLNRFFDRISPITGKDMQANIEKSLRALKTDYIDYYFIHEPHESLIYIDELLATADKLKQDGKIRALGLAYNQSQLHFHQAYIDKFDILQFNNSPGIAEYENIRLQRADKHNIFFSAMSGGVKKMTAAEKFTKLYQDFPDSVILSSTFNEKHLKENVACANKLSL